MSDSFKKQPVNNKVVEVLVNSIFHKNGVKPEEIKKNVTEEQKEMIRDMVKDLKAQVEEFDEKNQSVDDDGEDE